MLGSNLIRFQKDARWVTFDFESSGLNLWAAKPWELSWAICSLNDGVIESKTRMIYWKDFDISDELARKVHFDRTKYEANAQAPEEVWKEFAPVIFDPSIRSVGHNLLGFDVYMIKTWQRLMGAAQDFSWIGGVKDKYPLIDTNCLAKAYRKEIKPDVSSSSALLSFQYKMESFREKGLKTSLGTMCSLFGIDYNAQEAHSAEYDVRANWQLFRELVFKIDI